MLEQGVGGGHDLSHLVPEFQATAIDLSEEILENSAPFNLDVRHHVDDMRNVHLMRAFDAVTVRAAIPYMTTEADLRATFYSATVHRGQREAYSSPLPTGSERRSLA